MQLAKLEIKGFKSFADKITIHFNKGVTSIVGPNGCGKSNIVDAIRWVLGEQKIRSLRSKKMENIIFNGTKKRKPLQLAEVSLTIDNTKNIISAEYSQITITRRLYRSGESEYLINQVPCRLKDIFNLFLNTGVSAENYAIIELSMIEELLSDHENSRRKLFEEAAGISKFKKRKKETLQKMEATDEDLNRVEDLLYEIDKNMKSLEKQAQKAKKYYRTKQEYQQKSIRLGALTIEKEKEQFGKIQQQTKSASDHKMELAAETAKHEAAIEQHKNTVENKEKELLEQQKQINTYGIKVQQYESQQQIKKERVNSLHNRVQQLKERIEQDKKDKEKIQSGIQHLQEEKDKAQTCLNETLKSTEAAKNSHNNQKEQYTALQHQADQLQNVYRKQQDEYHKLNKEQEIRKMQITLLEQEANRANIDADQQRTDIVNFEKNLLNLQTQIDQKRENLQSLKKQESNIQNAVLELEKNINTSRDKSITIERKLDARKNEYQLIKSMVENMEGFPEAIKFLNTDNRWSNKSPVLSEIISTTEAYRVTIENYLNSYLNYYIVEDHKEALHAINILNGATKGKANFFLLNAFKNFTPSPTTNYPDAFPAIQILEYDPKYKALLCYLLEKVYIYTGDINTIAPEEENNFITPNGDIIRKFFSISGGSVGLFEGKKIGRKKNLEKLEKEIKSLTQEGEDIKKIITDLQKQLKGLQQDTVKQQIESILDTIKGINDEYISVKTKKEQFLKTIDSITTRKGNIEEKIKCLKKEIDEINPTATAALAELNQQQQQLDHIANNLNIENTTLTQQASLLHEERILYNQQENDINSIAQEIQFKKESITQATLRIQENTTELENSTHEIKTTTGAMHDIDKKLFDMYAQKETKQNVLSQAEKNYYIAKKESEEMEKALKSVQRQRENIDSELMQLQNELTESKFRLNSIKERLSVEFQIDPDKIMEHQQQEENTTEQALRDQIDTIKDKMEKMGPINPMAMEAYDEIKERNNFISKQKEDLVKAKETLFETINEIEKTASQSFMEAFEKVQKHFVDVFRSLFQKEDTCELKLVDPTHPLESPIEIIAQPKGKRPITINQLSGGEKTLTAIALLFSLYLIKPAPFCIFDEVDAPLDDANIDKFNKITRNFSKESQFIVITHNKRTMMNTDVIYGITMEEEGISKVVPVDLRPFS